MKDEGKKGRTRWNSQQCDRGQTEHERRDSPFGFLLSLLVYSTYTDNTYTHITVTASAAPLPVSVLLVSFQFFGRGGGGCFLSFAHSCWVRMCVYQAMSSRYPTTISTLLEDDTISKLKGCSLIHKEAPQQVTLHV